MQTNFTSLVGVKLATFVLSALVAVSATYWGLRGGASTSQGYVPVAATVMPPVESQAVAKALGGGVVAIAASPEASSRFALAGVLADTAHGGAALIAVDGKAAKPFRVGASVDGRLVLKSVDGRRAVLAAGVDAPAEVLLELPVLGK